MKYYFLIIALYFSSCLHEKNVDSIIENEFINIENVAVNDTIHYNVYIRNTTSFDIYIDTIMTSCECVELENRVHLLKRGGRDSIKVLFVPDSEGYISRGLSIRYNGIVKNVIIEGYVQSNHDM